MKRRYIRLTILTIAAAWFFVSCADTSSGGGSTITAGTEDSATAVIDNGILTDPVNGVSAGLSLDNNITAESEAEIYGDIEWVGGISGMGIRMDSDGEFILLPDSDLIDLIGDGSVEVWVYPEEYTAFAGILHKGVEPDFSDEAWSLQYWTGNRPSFLLYNEEGVSKQITAPAALALGEWHHLAAAWNETELNFYINGVLIGSADLTDFHPIKNSDGALIIGSQLPLQYNSTYGHLTFRGIIDNVTLYSRTLSAEEVSFNHSLLAD